MRLPIAANLQHMPPPSAACMTAEINAGYDGPLSRTRGLRCYSQRSTPCLQTSLKLLLWARLMYQYEEVRCH